jgi:hypothetical protein
VHEVFARTPYDPNVMQAPDQPLTVQETATARAIS